MKNITPKKSRAMMRFFLDSPRSFIGRFRVIAIEVFRPLNASMDLEEWSEAYRWLFAMSNRTKGLARINSLLGGYLAQESVSMAHIKRVAGD